MKKSRILAAVCACFIGITTSHGVWASLASVTRFNITTIVADDDVTGSDNLNDTTIPSTATLTGTVGNNSSMMTQNFTSTANRATLGYSFIHSFDNTIGDTMGSDYGESEVMTLLFTANTDANYSIDGLYQMTGPSSTYTYFRFKLDDFSNGLNLLYDISSSISTENELFILGEVGDGDSYNLTMGSLSGNLIAGHEYELELSLFIQSWHGAQVAATAEGYVNLNINAVPIPSAIWLFASGLLGLVGIARRKSHFSNSQKSET